MGTRVRVVSSLKKQDVHSLCQTDFGFTKYFWTLMSPWSPSLKPILTLLQVQGLDRDSRLLSQPAVPWQKEAKTSNSSINTI